MAKKKIAQVGPSSQPEVSAEASAFKLPEVIQNPPEKAPTTLNQKTMIQLCTQHGIPEADALLPSSEQYAHSPPTGYITVNRFMLSHGAIPPFNNYLARILQRLAIAPSQLHPNGHAALLSLGVLFMKLHQRVPSFEEVCFFFTFVRNKIHTSIIFIKGARSRSFLLDLPESAHGFLTQYFYVRSPPGFYSLWREGGEHHSHCLDFSHKFPGLSANFTCLFSSNSRAQQRC